MKQIFIHGLGQAPSSWEKTVSHLENKEYLIPDLSLFLKDGEEEYENLYCGFSAYCDDISEPVSLCGLSLGAVIALNYAVDNPERVKSLILIAGQYRMPKMLLRLQNIIFRFMPESAFENIGFKRDSFIKLTNSMMNLNFSEALKDISCPVLILCGEKDGANKKSANELAKKIANAEIQLIENSGHEVNVDAPEKLAGIIDDFYRRKGLSV
ncbi:MAG: alpha/beta fold hydrolase [Acutalibacteraceae bacterium]